MRALFPHTHPHRPDPPTRFETYHILLRHRLISTASSMPALPCSTHAPVSNKPASSPPSRKCIAPRPHSLHCMTNPHVPCLSCVYCTPALYTATLIALSRNPTLTHHAPIFAALVLSASLLLRIPCTPAYLGRLPCIPPSDIPRIPPADICIPPRPRIHHSSHPHPHTYLRIWTVHCITHPRLAPQLSAV
ncbi:hypothetical protein BV25DRAFT_225034 [Artomyces pyxidatus]|uniref:Uncharacterized protein n=1 Tax=Artomyces pyxidatus TaxID=48021 RepID=A0ACB8TA43_9AGAM|nr:hypothetical protein BV25DRAFT_225034 [Artomyces pyxidatus]